MFGRNLNLQRTLAPGEKVITASTQDATPGAFLFAEAGASYLSTIREFDLFVKDPTGTPASSLIREVTSDTAGETYEDLALNADTYDVIRASSAIFRPGEGAEWAIHGVQAKGVNAVTPLILFATDGVRMTKLHTSTDAEGFIWLDQQFKVDYSLWLKVLYFGSRSLDVVGQGINKTVDYLGTT